MVDDFDGINKGEVREEIDHVFLIWRSPPEHVPGNTTQS